MTRANAAQALLATLVVGVAIAFYDWRLGAVAAGAMLWLDSWRMAR